jgi:hypothetical protein
MYEEETRVFTTERGGENTQYPIFGLKKFRVRFLFRWAALAVLGG